MEKQLAFICAWLAALTALVLRPDILGDVRSLLLRTSGSTGGVEEPYNGVTSGSSEEYEELYYGVTSSDVKVLSYDPFIAYVSNLVFPEEREYLIQLSTPMLEKSTVEYANGSKMQSEERTSSTAYLPKYDPVVATVLQRAADFQGYLPFEKLDMQVTSYQQGQQYRPHWDWFLEPNRTSNRLSTFFAILDADCENCGTQFPNLRVDWSQRDQRWCEIVDCSQNVLTTRNVPGSAVFWRNLDMTGQGRDDVLHAGLPALGGTKIGLNIWTDVDLNTFGSSIGDGKTLQP